MPDLSESLVDRDLGHLCIVAEFWGIDLNAPDARSALPKLVSAMLNPKLVVEITNDLPDEARSALQDLLLHNNRIPWALFTRRYGEVREMGPGKRDREQPYLNPVSTSELLWYYGLIARAFFEIPAGLEEFAYIPDDLRANLPISANKPHTVFGRSAYSSERLHVIPPSDLILDHACTLLAALRTGLLVPAEFNIPAPAYPLSTVVLQSLLNSAGILDKAFQPVPDVARSFLESTRSEALANLTKAWLQSKGFDELRLLPGLSAEGSWQNDPLSTRRLLLGFLQDLPADQWWNLESFIAAIKQGEPDFQRSGGDYDTWFIRSLETNEFLRGFEHWDDIEGALLTFFIAGPLYWLGILELAAMREDGPVTAFRRSGWAESLLTGQAPLRLPLEDAKVIIRSDAHLHVPRLVPRAIRYQIARFCEWDKETLDGYDYHMSTASLSRAKQQGLAIGHLLALLRKSTEAVPPSLVKALERWETYGSQARIDKLSVLRFNSPEVLQALRRSRAERFLGDPLGPAAIAIKAGAEQKVMAILIELGYFGDWKIDH